MDMQPAPAPKLPAGFIPVSTSNLRGLKWSACPGEDPCAPGTGHLEIVYTNGTQYTYLGVPHETYRTIMESPNVGRAFNLLILKAEPKFLFERMLPAVHHTDLKGTVSA